MSRIRIAVAAVATTTALLCALPSGASATTSTFNCTGSSATFTVPSGISKLWFDVQGAGGGWGGSGETSFWGTNNGGRGGNGAQYTGALAVTPGQVITVKVGCKGGGGANKADNGSGGAGGWGAYTGGTGGRSGGTSCGWFCSKNKTGGGGGGGGASGITLGSIYVVAGGGGGGGGGAWNSTGGGAYGATQGSALANGSNGANAGAGNGGGGASGGGGGVGQSAGGGDNGGNGGQNGRSGVPTVADLTSVTFNSTGGPGVDTNGSISISYIATDLAFSGAPSGDRYETSESIAFTGDSGASFTCSVDGGSYSACTSPKSLTGLALGDHTLSVKQTVAGFTTDAITASWTTARPPFPDITSGLVPYSSTSTLNSGGYANTLTPSIGFSTVSGATVSCSTNGGTSYSACSSPVNYASLLGTALVDGRSYPLTVKQVTSTGNVSRQISFTVDVTAPPAPALQGGWAGSGTTWSNSTTVTPGVSNKSSDFSKFICSLDDGAWADCGTSTVSLSGVTEGSHTLKIKQVDKAGNASAQTTRAFTVDLTPPAAPTWVKQAPQFVSYVNSRFELNWNGSLEDGASWQCDVEGQGSIRWDNYVSRFRIGGYNQAWINSFPSLAPCGFDKYKGFTLNSGWYGASLYRKDDPGANWASMTYSQWPDHNSSYFAIRQVDAAGNASAWLRTDWTMDWDPPAAPVVASGPGRFIKSSSTSITLAPGESDSTYTCAIDTKPAGPCTSPISLTGLTDGYHRVTINQIDHAGQSSSNTVVGFTVDTVAPIAPRVDRATPSGASVNNDSITLGFAYSDLERDSSGAYMTECSLDGGPWTTCSGGATQSYTGLSEGAHSFQVRQSDAAGNVGSPTTYSWTVDKTAPAAPTMACPTPLNPTYAGFRTALKGGICYVHASPAGGTSTTLDPDFKTESGATLECRSTVPTGGSVTGGPSATARAAWAPCSSYTGFSRPAWATLTSSGSFYTYEARATDPAGNVGPSSTFKFNVDETAPLNATLSTKPLAAPKTGSENDSTPTFGFTLNGGADTSLQKVKCAIRPQRSFWPGSAATSPSSYFDCTDGFTSDELAGGWWTLFYYTEDEVLNYATPLQEYGLASGSYEFIVLPKPSKPRVVFKETNFDSVYTGNYCDSWQTFSDRGEFGLECPDLTTHKFGGGVELSVSTDNDSTNNQTFGAVVDKVECAWEGPGISSLTWSECPNKSGPAGSGSSYRYVFSKKASGTWTLHTRGKNTVGYGPEQTATFTIDADAPAKPTVNFATPSSQAGKSGEAWKTGPFQYGSSTPYQSTSLPTFNGSSVSFDITPAEVAMSDLTNTYWGRSDSSGYRFFSSLRCSLYGPVLALGWDGNRYAEDSVTAYGNCDKVIDALQHLNPGATGYMYELRVSEVDGGANVSAPTIVYFRAASGPAKVKDFKTMSSSPTSSDSITYSLTFDTDVTGLTAADFEATGTSTGWAVDSISGSGSGPYTVTLKGTSTTDGTVGLKLAKDAGQSATGDNSPTASVEAGSGAKVTIDHTAPGGFATETGGITNNTSLTYALDFSEAVTGLTAADLTVGGTATGWTVTSVSGSGKHWTVTVSAGSGATDGTVKLTLAAGSVLDAASNAGPGTDVSTAESTVDRTAPAAPTLTKVPGAKTGEAMSSIAWTGEDGGSFECSTTAGSWYPCRSPEAVSSENSSSFRVRQTDQAGNTGIAASTAWEYTGSLPSAPDIAGAPSGATQTTSASLTFGPAQSGGGTFKCSVDRGAYEVCTSPLDLTGLSEGDHSVSVREVTVGGRNGEVATATWSVDNTAPAKPDVTSAPKSRVKTDSASISFTSEGGATVKCSVDGATATTCTSPLELSGLSEGSHTVSIYQVDQAGNTGEAKEVTWTVDTTAPAPPMLNGKPSSTTTETSFSISALDESDASFECKLDSGAWASCSSPFAASGLALGEHTVQIRAVDVAGNVGTAGTATWTVISEGLPVPTVSQAFTSPVSDSTPRFNLTSDDGNSFECSIDNGSWAACTSPYTPAALGDGEHTLRVRETDGSGSYSTAVSSTFTVDTTAPAKPTITSQPTDGTLSTSGSVEFTEVSGLTYRCRVDDGAWQDDCHSPVDLTGLAVGQHKVRITATDAAGNQSDAQIVDWTISGAAVDAPTISTTLPSPTKSTSASVEFTLPADTVSECSLDGSDWTRCESPWTTSGLSDGSHTLRVRAADHDGNRSGGVATSWTVDTAPPALPTISSKPASSTASTSATVAFSSDSGSTFLCSVDGGGYDSCTSPVSLSDLEGGSHTVAIKAADALGNVSAAATASWTVTQPSTPVFRLFPGAKTNQTSESINWQTAEQTTAFQCSLDGAAWAACSSSELNAHSKSLSGLALGDHTFKVRSQVGGGGAWSQPAVVNWTVVNTSSIGAPTITSTPALATDSATGWKWTNTNSPTFTLNAAGAVSYECTDLKARGATSQERLENAAWHACSAQELSPTGLQESSTYGAHTLIARAVDANGVRGPQVELNYMVDTQIQTPAWTSKPPRSNNTDYDLNDILVSSGENSNSFKQFQCKVNGSATWGSCRINTTNYPNIGTFRTNGATTTVLARQVDKAGNVSGPSETYSWIHDNVAPTKPSWISRPTGNTTSTSATISFRVPTAPSGQYYTTLCWKDTGWMPCSSPFTWNDLSGGRHVFAVLVMDDAGNESEQIVTEWNVSKPSVSNVSITPDSDPVGVHTELEATGGALTGEAGASAGRVVWERCTVADTPVCTPVASKDASQRKYYLVEADMGYKMRATVTWKTLGGVTTSKTSGLSGIVVPTAAASEFIFQTGQTGPVRGRTMGMKAGRIEGFNGLPDKGVQWQRCTGTTADTCTNITGGLGLRYTPVAADVGKHLRAVWSLTAPTSGALKGYQIKSATPLSSVVAAK